MEVELHIVWGLARGSLKCRGFGLRDLGFGLGILVTFGKASMGFRIWGLISFLVAYSHNFTPLRQSHFLIPFPTSQARPLNILGRLLAQDCSP